MKEYQKQFDRQEAIQPQVSLPDFDWLLERNHDHWIVKQPGIIPYRNEDGRWMEAYEIRFDRRLYDGSLLTEKKNSLFLSDIKNALIWARSNSKSRSHLLDALCRDMTYIVCFGQRMQEESEINVRNGHHQLFQFVSFGVLKPGHFDEFLKRGSMGAAFVKGAGYKVIETIETLKNESTLSSLLNNGKIDFSTLARKSGIHGHQALASNELIKKLLTQELNLSGPEQTKNREINVLNSSFWSKSEYPDASWRNFTECSSELIEDEDEIDDRKYDISTSRLTAYFEAWNTLYDGAENMTSPLSFRASNHTTVEKAAEQYGFRNKRKTLDIPTSTALQYLDGAIAYVHRYGEALVSYSLDLDNELKRRRIKAPKSALDHLAPQIFKRIDQPETLKTLNITRFHNFPTNAGRSFSDLRVEMSIPEALELFYAAVFILATTFTASRPTAIRQLRSNCLLLSVIDGRYDLGYRLNKSSEIEELNLILRPIPEFVANAVDLVGRLSDAKYEEDGEYPEKFLFVKRFNDGRLGGIDREALFKSIVKFADFINITPSDGKRWYLRTNQIRRFFAKAYFHWDSHSDLKSLAWLMGHPDMEETWGYCVSDIIGDELSIEARNAAAQALKNQGQSNVEFSADLGDLLNGVNDDFNDLGFVDEDILDAYIENLITEQEWNLSIARVDSENEKDKTLFIFKEKRHAKV